MLYVVQQQDFRPHGAEKHGEKAEEQQCPFTCGVGSHVVRAS